MIYNTIHGIPESSAFFQGNTEQFFTRKFGKNLSFKVSRIYWDSEEEFNVEKYRAEFSRRINVLIADRISKNGGTSFHTIAASSLNIKPVKLAKEDDDICGNFKIDPPIGICTKDGCNQYFVLSEGRKCNHKNTDSWEQFTFLASCDYCGRTVPLHYMTNIMNKCKKCNKEESMLKLIWPKGGKENIKQYRVRCVECGHEESLFFFKCNHKNGELAEDSTNNTKKHNFRAVPARANAILHPYVISIPDVSQNDGESHTGLSKAASEAFVSLFGYDIEEAKLFSPQFRDILQKNTEFWSLPRIESIVEDLSDTFTIEISDIENINSNAFSDILKNVLIESHSRSINNPNKDSILNKYGIEYIKKSLFSIRSIKFYEDDLQGLQLINTHNSSKKERPITPPTNYNLWLENYGLEKVCHFSNLSMIQALIGVVEGSTRRNPLLFRTIDVGHPDPKPTSYVRTYNTEGILFQLSPIRVLKWLDANKDRLMLTSNVLPLINERYIFPHYMDVIMNSDECRSAVTSLIHTYSHMLVQQSSVNTGLDIQSVSEIIYPSVASFIIFSTNSINMGGLEYVYNYHLDSWFEMVKDLAKSCPQDPACMIAEGGACNSCSYLPEFVCCNFNNNLDRSTLVGDSERFSEGFFK